MTSPRVPAPHCDRCGRPDAHPFDRTWLCVDCYQQTASSCAGTTCDDLPVPTENEPA
jgi:hypothetical protein